MGDRRGIEMNLPMSRPNSVEECQPWNNQPWFIGSTPPIVIIWYLFMVPVDEFSIIFHYSPVINLILTIYLPIYHVPPQFNSHGGDTVLAGMGEGPRPAHHSWHAWACRTCPVGVPRGWLKKMKTWRCPKPGGFSWNRGTPSHHPFLRYFSINHPAMGYPHDYGNSLELLSENKEYWNPWFWGSPVLWNTWPSGSQWSLVNLGPSSNFRGGKNCSWSHQRREDGDLFWACLSNKMLTPHAPFLKQRNVWRWHEDKTGAAGSGMEWDVEE